MSRAGRKLQVGDEALTDFNGKGLTLVQIVERITDAASQSRIMFRVSPPLNGGNKFSWYDADWFEPAPKNLL